jgi:hypothetical protein
MITKSILTATAALVVATSFASIATAQRAPRQEVQTVQPFTEAERNWFLIPEGNLTGMPRH